MEGIGGLVIDNIREVEGVGRAMIRAFFAQTKEQGR